MHRNGSEVTYLCLTIDENGTFKSCMKSLYNEGLKAMFKVKKIITPPSNVSTCLHLFNHLVKPILVYGSEVWSLSLFAERNHKRINKENLESIYISQRTPIEKALLKYSKIVLGILGNTDNPAPYGELGIWISTLYCCY